MLLIIVLTHYVPTSFFSGNIARPAAAVMLTVTGYFFMRIVEREHGLRGALGDRCKAALRLSFQRHMRIWPAVAGVVLMYVALGYLVPGRLTNQIHHTWPLYLAYMGNVVKMWYEADAFPAHFWLISAQEQFVFLVLVALVTFGADRIKHMITVAVVVGVAARLIGCFLWMPDHPALATESPFAVADALALGMLCRTAVAANVGTTTLRRRVTLGAICVFLLWAALPNTYAIYFGLMPLLTALIGCLIILTLGDEVRVRRFEQAMLSWPAVVLLGQISLSLFLLHPLVNTIINLAYARETGEILPWWLLAMIGPPASIVVAYGYFRAVEVPIRRFRSSAVRRSPVRLANGAPRTPLAATPARAFGRSLAVTS